MTTVYYSPEKEEIRPSLSKRPTRHEEDSQEDTTTLLRRKHSKIDDFKKPVTANPLKESSSLVPAPRTTITLSYKIAQPNFEENPHCFAFLQGLLPGYGSHYLMKKKDSSDNRAGYVIGRDPECDITIDKNEVSRSHCLIYMETGSNGVAKGIRIYLEDLSSNGTFVNGKVVGRNNRILLRNGNRIQLFQRTKFDENHEKNLCYRICFPPVFEANSCESEYEFTSELGKGNFATVYHAFRRNTEKEVAIKVMIKSRFERKPKLLKSIIQEIGIMMALKKHPLVVQIKEIFNEQSRLFLVLEYVRDGELFNYIREVKNLSENETRFIFWQLFHAIQYLHHCNIAHRDLKPENVILADKKKLHVKISDFGLAKTEDRDRAFDSQCGTPNYVAPEILNPSEIRGYDKLCDMWSLGVMLYICLCGYPPFSDENGPPSMKAQIKMGKYAFQSPYWDAISVDAKKLIAELLVVDPANRATATEALTHNWMQLNPEDLERRKNALDPTALAEIEKFSSPQVVPDTQPPMSQTQSLSLGLY